MNDEPEEVEVLEAAMLAAKQKYGYTELTINLSPAGMWTCVAVYADGALATAHGATLRAAMCSASVDALNTQGR